MRHGQAKSCYPVPWLEVLRRCGDGQWSGLIAARLLYTVHPLAAFLRALPEVSDPDSRPSGVAPGLSTKLDGSTSFQLTGRTLPVCVRLSTDDTVAGSEPSQVSASFWETGVWGYLPPTSDSPQICMVAWARSCISLAHGVAPILKLCYFSS